MLHLSTKNLKIRCDFTWTALVLFVTISSACAVNSSYHLENNIGLYQIVDKKCEVLPGAFNPCETTQYIEIVKGQFFGVKDREIALVFWTGDSKVDPELQYTAQLIKDHTRAKLSGEIIWLNDDKTTQEYLVLANHQLHRYVFKAMGKNKKVIRHIEYTLKPVLRGNLPHVRLNYPGD